MTLNISSDGFFAQTRKPPIRQGFARVETILEEKKYNSELQIGRFFYLANGRNVCVLGNPHH